MDTEMADLEYATNAVRMLEGSYKNQAHDPKTYAKQLIVACVGQPKWLLRKMVHPVDGFVAKEKFPSVAALSDWFDKELSWAPTLNYYQKRIEQQLAERDAGPEVSDEEKAASMEMWARVKEQIAETTQEMRRLGKVVGKRIEPKQDHHPEKLRAAIGNLEESNRKGPLPVAHRNSA